MTVFKYNKGKLVEQPTMEKPADNEHWVATAWIAANKQYEEHLSSLRTYIAEGFAEDEMVEEKDFELVCRYGKHCYTLGTHVCQYIARKVTKEEGGKPVFNTHPSDAAAEENEDKIILQEAKTDAFIRQWFDKWCKNTKRSGGVLITTSIRELLTDFYNDIQSSQSVRPDVCRAALEKNIEMNRQQAEDQYGDPNKAETWSCVKIAREALSGKQEGDKTKNTEP